ncbi:MAG: 3'-5' exonuclease, partial [Firmicutes bacterium]|nr:3'-5' exonuclease [Bacillota bacterium]
MDKKELLKYLLQNMKITIDRDSLVTERHKGRSLIDFPSDCCVIDIETTGLDYFYDEIIEISAIKVVDGHFSDTFSQLVRPDEPISDFITKLTGITNDMLADKPSIKDALPLFLDFIGDSLLVGYNVNFDINFLYDAAKEYLNVEFDNDYVDV